MLVLLEPVVRGPGFELLSSAHGSLVRCGRHAGRREHVYDSQ